MVAFAPTFRPIPVPANQPVLYQISIRSPDSIFSEFATFTFPLSPAAVRYSRPQLSSVGDVQGPPSSQGVTRYTDVYGQAPPQIVIEGTTGWDRHNTDGYILTGLQSIILLKQFISRYATLNQKQLQLGTGDMFTLEWYDYFQDEFWVVEPVGPQLIWQDNSRPLLTNYRFIFAASKKPGIIEIIAHGVDAVAQLVATPAEQAALMAVQTVSAIAVAYGPTGLLSSLPSFNP